MTKLTNFTLDGDAVRLVGRKDQHGADLYDLTIMPAFDRRGLTREELMEFAIGIMNDVMWGGMLNVCAGDFTDATLKEFQRGGDANDQQEDCA